MKAPEILNALKEFSIAKCLNAEELDLIITTGSFKIVEKNHHIFEYGQISDEIYFLLEGVVKITTNINDGREVIKLILHPKAILGELSLAGEGTRSSNSTVMSSKAKVLAIKIEVIKELMLNNHQLAFCIINFLGRKLKNSDERLESLVLNDARERIVQFLKVNAQSFGQQIGFEMLLKHNFTQQDIANYTGTSRQTVTTVLNNLKKTNKIHFKRKSILIRDLATLS